MTRITPGSRRGAWVVLSIASAALIAFGCTSLNSIVGAECAPGFVERDGICVVDTNDGSIDGTILDGATDGVPPSDGTLSDRPPGDATASDGSNAGDPGDADGGSFACDAGLTYCSGECVDLMTNPLHCGQCGNVCQTLLCSGGKCQGALNGHVVVIGHDYSGAYSSAQSKLLGNCALLTPVTNIKVRSWEAQAVPPSVNAVNGIVKAAIVAANRTYVFTTATLPSDVTSTTILNTDILILHDQRSATTGTLGPLGATFAASLATFTNAGGIVIVTDSGLAEMPAFVKQAGLLDLAGDNAISFGTPVNMIAPGDAVGLGVPTPYGAGNKSVWLASNEPNAWFVTYVVVDPSNEAGTSRPVVIHKVIP